MTLLDLEVLVPDLDAMGEAIVRMDLGHIVIDHSLITDRPAMLAFESTNG